MSEGERKYKIRLSSGRILGPLELNHLKVLIQSGKVDGSESARVYPEGEWMSASQIPELAQLILDKVQNKSSADPEAGDETVAANAPTAILPGATEVLTGETAMEELPELPTSSAMAAGTPKQGPSPEAALPDAAGGEEDERTAMVSPGTSISAERPVTKEGAEEDREDRTIIASSSKGKSATENLPALELDSSPGPEGKKEEAAKEEAQALEKFQMSDPLARKIAREETVVFQHSAGAQNIRLFKGKNRKLGEIIKAGAIAIGLGIVGYQLFLSDPQQAKTSARPEPIRPSMPAQGECKANPDESVKIYAGALPYYLADTVQGYKTAAERFRRSACLDAGNVKALAMLASCYLNLIDSSNKDENYFVVISRLIDMARAKAADLPEVVIADFEFFMTANKPEAAQNRINEYTKTHQFGKEYGKEMFYYVALGYFARGDLRSAAKFISQIEDERAFSVKVLYLKGRIAEKSGDVDSALVEYQKAIQYNPEHVLSRLRIAEIYNGRGKLRESADNIAYLISHGAFLPPKELAESYYLHAQLSELFEKWPLALSDMERAVRLDGTNSDYLLELYTLRARNGGSEDALRADARMYIFMGEGEKYLKQGQYHEALSQFLLAREASEKSPLPLVKIGDMFMRLHDLANARTNYKMAADRAPNNIEVWTKYIDVLIQSFDWEEAQKAMVRFRQMPVNQSAVDKAAADMYQKQGKYQEALLYYQKAMSYAVIDTSVYLAYAKCLVTLKDYKDAPFFFALALRFDPLSIEAIVGNAKCLAASESIDRAISMLQDELQKGTVSQAELLSSIAEFQIQKGDWAGAQANIDAAMSNNPDLAYPWKLQAQIDLNKQVEDKKAEDKALDDYQAYCDRNPSDPTGYIERYRLFLKKTEFDKASEELGKVFAIYPKYPNLHYFKGALYSVMGNHKVAVEEFKTELANNAENIPDMLALGKELLEMGAALDALKYFNTAMQKDPRSAEPKHLSGYANYALKNYQGAVALYNTALKIDPANPVIYKHLGMAYRDMGDQQGAAAAFRKYLEMEPDAPDKAQFGAYR